MVDATVLLVTLTSQRGLGLAGEPGIQLTCNRDIDATWYEPLCRTFRRALRYDIYAGANARGISQANREILDLVETFRPRYLLHMCDFTGLVTDTTLQAARRSGTHVLGFFFDDEVLFETRSRWMLPNLDYAVTNTPSVVEPYRRMGARARLMVPIIPVNGSVFSKLPGVPKEHDAGFVGTLHGERERAMADIAKAGADVFVYGRGYRDPGLSTAEFVRAVNRTRVNLSFTSNPNDPNAPHQLKGRLFEIPMCGGFLLTEDMPLLGKYFDVGREVDVFQSPAEAADKIRYYLAHEKEREEMANRAHQRALRQYEAHETLRALFEHLEADLHQNGRPAPVAAVEQPNPLRRSMAEHYFAWARAELRRVDTRRTRWKEYAAMALEHDPELKGPATLLRKAERWGDPEALRGWLKRAGWTVEHVCRRAWASVTFRISSALS
ncbi:MAG: glycosyltransferase [Nitrospirae bacterium]|nr:glycosyltransferase [Nitrospirota bacterium]